MIPAFIAARALSKMREDENEHRVGAYVGYAMTPDDEDEDDVFPVDDESDEGDDDDDEEVLQCKGSSPPAPPTPMETIMAQIELERAQARIREEERVAQEGRTRADYDRKVVEATPRQAQAYADAAGYFDDYAGAQGYDQSLLEQYGAGNLYRRDIDRQKSMIAPDNTSPTGSYNTQTAFDDAIAAALGGYRADTRRGVYGAAGDGFEYGLFGNNADDAILSEILGERRADALSTIDAAKARGQLNDAGYTRALGTLSDQGDAAMSQLQRLGEGVLSGYRQNLTGMRDSAVDRIGRMTFSDPRFNMDAFNTRLNDAVGGMRNNMRGDIFSAIGNQSFFDPSSAIGGAGAIQGYYNPTSSVKRKAATASGNPLLDAFANYGSSGNGAF